MNILNYHKLVNLKKKLERFDCETSKELIQVINTQLVIQLENSKQKDKERRINYKQEMVKCEICEKEMIRNSFYKHKNKCIPNTQNTP